MEIFKFHATVALLLCVKLCRGQSVNVFELENAVGGAGKNRSPWRSEASGSSSLHMFKGDMLTIDLCLTEPSSVTISGLDYSNDGQSDLLSFAIDNNPLATVNTVKTNDGWGKHWNIYKSSGPIGTDMKLGAGKHTLSITVNDADCHGTEFDALTIGVDTNIDKNTLFCGSALFPSADPSPCAVAIDSPTTTSAPSTSTIANTPVNLQDTSSVAITKQTTPTPASTSTSSNSLATSPATLTTVTTARVTTAATPPDTSSSGSVETMTTASQTTKSSSSSQSTSSKSPSSESTSSESLGSSETKTTASSGTTASSSQSSSSESLGSGETKTTASPSTTASSSQSSSSESLGSGETKTTASSGTTASSSQSSSSESLGSSETKTTASSGTTASSSQSSSSESLGSRETKTTASSGTTASSSQSSSSLGLGETKPTPSSSVATTSVPSTASVTSVTSVSTHSFTTARTTPTTTATIASSTSIQTETTPTVAVPSSIISTSTTSVSTPTTQTVQTTPITKPLVEQRSFTSDCLEDTNVNILFRPVSLVNTQLIARELPRALRRRSAPGPNLGLTCDTLIWQIDYHQLGRPVNSSSPVIDHDVNIATTNRVPFPASINPVVTKEVVLRYIVPERVNIKRGRLLFTLQLTGVTQKMRVGIQYINRAKRTPSKILYATFKPNKQSVTWQIPARSVSPSLENVLKLVLQHASDTVNIDFLKLEYKKADVRTRSKVIGSVPKWKVRGDLIVRSNVPAGMEVVLNGQKQAGTFTQCTIIKKPNFALLSVNANGELYVAHKSRRGKRVGSRDEDNTQPTGQILKDVSGFTLGSTDRHIARADINTDTSQVTLTYDDGNVVKLSYEYSRVRSKVIVTSSTLPSDVLHFFSTYISEDLAAVNTMVVDKQLTGPVNIMSNAIGGNSGQRFTFTKSTANPKLRANDEIEVILP